jgi:hypothetical protein
VLTSAVQVRPGSRLCRFNTFGPACLTANVGHSSCMSTPRSGTFTGFVIGAVVAAIAFGALIAVMAAGMGHGPHEVGDVLFTLFQGLFVCLIGGAIGAGVGALVSKGNRP